MLNKNSTIHVVLMIRGEFNKFVELGIFLYNSRFLFSLLEVYNANPEDFHTLLVTGDETWLQHWDPDTKKESMQWKRPDLPPPKKFRTQPSASKVMATVF